MSSDDTHVSDPQVPPAGESIHLPPGSLQPLFLTIGITLILLGLTSSTVLLLVGIATFIVTLYLWIRDAVIEFRGLSEHGDDH